MSQVLKLGRKTVANYGAKEDASVKASGGPTEVDYCTTLCWTWHSNCQPIDMTWNAPPTRSCA